MKSKVLAMNVLKVCNSQNAVSLYSYIIMTKKINKALQFSSPSIFL